MIAPSALAGGTIVSNKCADTKHYRDLMEHSADGPTPIKTVLHCIFPTDITGPLCWKTILQVKDNDQN